MHRNPSIPTSGAPRRFEDVWRDDRGYLLGLATRMLGDATEAEDTVQEAFGRLARVELDEIDDPRGWLAVVVRRLCLDRLRSARSRRESAAGASVPEPIVQRRDDAHGDPADRVTLDDQVQRALAVVLDRLTPPERTAYVLHDVFGFSFNAVSEIVGRTPAACRQLASRARRSIRSEDAQVANAHAVGGTDHGLVVERFIAACAGGDMAELMAVLDPDVVGGAIMLGRGPIVVVEGRPDVARRIIALFGPATDTTMLPFLVDGDPGVLVFRKGRVRAVLRLEAEQGRIRHIDSFVQPAR